jgi:hypothetical protein
MKRTGHEMLERRYVIAFRSDYTRGEWVLISRHESYREALITFKAWEPDYEGGETDLALFAYQRGDDFRDGKIKREVRGWPNRPEKAIPSALGMLINELDSDWF